jgi:hypothetical protein
LKKVVTKRKRGRVTSIESAVIWGRPICTKENPCEICKREKKDRDHQNIKEVEYGYVRSIRWFGEDA